MDLCPMVRPRDCLVLVVSHPRPAYPLTVPSSSWRRNVHCRWSAGTRTTRTTLTPVGRRSSTSVKPHNLRTLRWEYHALCVRVCELHCIPVSSYIKRRRHTNVSSIQRGTTDKFLLCMSCITIIVSLCITYVCVLFECDRTRSMYKRCMRASHDAMQSVACNSNQAIKPKPICALLEPIHH